MKTSDQKNDVSLTRKTLAQKTKQEAENRLSKALRDNLFRRKAQARARKLKDIATDMPDRTESDSI